MPAWQTFVRDIETWSGAGRRGTGRYRLGNRHSAGHRRRVGGNGARTAGFRRDRRHVGRSAVAAQLGSGSSLDELYDRQIKGASKEISPSVDIEDITELFLNALSDPDATREQKLQRIGAVANTTPTVSEAVRREVIAQRLPSHDWPDRDLRITAIDIGTGELVGLRPGHRVSSWSTPSPPVAPCPAHGRR